VRLTSRFKRSSASSGMRAIGLSSKTCQGVD
jgi:hypothetical protein